MYNRVGFEDRRVSRPGLYSLVDHGDGTVTILPVVDEDDFLGTPVNASNLGRMEDGIEAVHQLMDGVDRRISRVEAYLDIDSRGVEGAQARFADTYDGTTDPVFQMDTTETYAVSAIALSASSVTVPVASVADFEVNREVTIASSSGVENRRISAINAGAKTITFPSVQYNHPKGALIARSTVEIDTVKQKMKVGSWGTYTVTITEV